MEDAETAFITAAITVSLAGVIGYIFYRIITVKRARLTANDYGRRWLALTVFIGTISTLPRFFRDFDLDSFARWIIAVVFFGCVAFVAGWLYGKFVMKKRERIVSIDTSNSNNINNSQNQAGNITKNKPLSLAGSEEDEKFYEIAWAEVEGENIKKSLWAKSFSECDGDNHRAKAKYISLRVAELKNREEKSSQENDIARSNAEANNNTQDESNVLGNIMLLLGVSFIVAIGWIIMTH